MFPDFSQLILFITATILLNLTPGADVLYISNKSLQGLKQGVIATLGIGTGIFIYAFATAFGLSSFLKESPLIFNIVKIIGAIYLIYLAWQSFTQQSSSLISSQLHQTKGWKTFKNGVLTNLLNPKVGIFFLTFLPQFVNLEAGSIQLQLLTLGILFVISGTIINLGYALLISRLNQFILCSQMTQKIINKLTGFIFCALAYKVLVAESNE